MLLFADDIQLKIANGGQWIDQSDRESEKSDMNFSTKNAKFNVYFVLF